MSRRPRVRALLASVAIAAALTLGGCDTEGTMPMGGRAFKALSPEMSNLLAKKGMPTESPMLVRIFKQESELEVWKQDANGKYALLKTYPICRWSGELGPKIREGDRQAPEGFYDITPAQMNPNSSYYLSFNLGYPNAFDRAHGRTGAHLMVHGDCSSRGCYSMTDEQIAEIYALARESFFGGQRSFQVQAYPFRMTPANFAKHRNNPHLAFWKMLKRGNDHFEVTGQEPKVDVCEKRYVFNAQQPASSTRPLAFSPAGRCPAYEISEDVANALNEKQRQDEYQTAELIRRGTPVAPIRTGADGGMHPVFLAKLRQQQQREVADNDGRIQALTPAAAPGSLPATVNPPRNPEMESTGTVAEAPASRTASRRAGAAQAEEPASPRSGGIFGFASSGTRVAANAPANQSSASGSSSGLFGNLFSSGSSSDQGVFSRMGRMIGLRGSEPPPQAQPQPAPPAPKPKPAARSTQTAAAAPAPKPAPRAAETPDTAAATTANAGAARPQAKPPEQAASAQPQERPASSASLMSGAQPTVPSSNFDSRWGGLR